MFLFFSLVHGIHIERLHLPFVNIEELYIKWDDKLIISLKKADILNNMPVNNKNETNTFALLGMLTDIPRYCKSVEIEDLHFRNINASIRYMQNQNGYLKLTTNDLNLTSDIFIDKENIYLHVRSLTYSPYDMKASGYILFEKPNENIKINLDIAILDEAFFNFDATLQKDKLTFTSNFLSPVQDPKKIVRRLHLPKSIEYWAADAYSCSHAEITKFQGSIDLNDLKNSIRTINVDAKVYDVTYTYNPKIAPVKADYVALKFHKGLFFIRPHNAKEYGYDLQNSYLSIDFLSKKTPLTLFLRFDHGRVDKNIVHILSVYGIEMPFVQTSGFVKTDLKLQIALSDMQVNAIGKFESNNSVFHYLDLDWNVKDVLVSLHDTDVQIKKMELHYKNNIAANLYADLHLGKHTGVIDIYPLHVELPNKVLSLQTKKPHIVYYINKTKVDTIMLPLTKWQLQNKTTVTVDAMKLAYNNRMKKLLLPVTQLNIEEKLKAYVSGTIDAAAKNADLDIDIVKLKFSDFLLAQSDLYMHLHATKNKTIVTTDKRARFEIGSSELMIEKILLTYANQQLNINNLILTIKNRLNCIFDFYYDMQKERGFLLLKNSKLQLTQNETLFQNDKPLKFTLLKKNGIKIKSDKLATIVNIDDNSSLKFFALHKLLPYSQLLQKIKLQKGELFINKNGNKWMLEGKLLSDFALLIKEEKKIDTYNIEGFIEPQKSKITINDNIEIKYKNNKLELDTSDIGIHLDGLESFIQVWKQPKKKKTPPLPFSFYAHLQNGYLYLSKARRVLFESLELQNIAGVTTAQLAYEEGHAGFRYKGDKFYLYGSGFNDEFMDNLFFQSKFKGGKLDFNIIGTLEKYDGIFEITDTTILDFKILNNILAFIDTIPSLITFSLPSYSTEGLYVKKAYASFHYEKDIFHFDNINLHSMQIDIVGKGKVSYKQDFVNLILQLKTHLAEQASKVPVVGYILFDGKTISTTLKIEGKLEDPKVSTMLAKDIAIAPLNIIKRTLLYPVHLLGLDKENNNSD